MMPNQLAHQILVQAFPEWMPLVQQQQITIQPLFGCWANKLYHVKINSPLAPTEYSQLIIRVFGNNTKVLNKDKEKALFHALTLQGTPIHEYATIDKYRIERFIPAHTISSSAMLGDDILTRFAEAICRYHHNKPLYDLLATIDGTTPHCIKILTSWLKEVKQNLPYYMSKCHAKGKIFENMINEFAVLQNEELCNALEKSLDSSKEGKLVCAHNDIHGGNMMMSDMHGFILIDFEFSAINYRAFDFALYCNEVAFDYAYPKPPFFTCDTNYKVTDAMLKLMCNHYMDYFYHHYYKGSQNEKEFVFEEAQKLFSEARNLMPLGILYWALCGLLVNDWDNFEEGNLIYPVTKMRLFKNEIDMLIHNIKH
jgi:thiamine kinase-like enzyme